jgi:hypothetical protein
MSTSISALRAIVFVSSLAMSCAEQRTPATAVAKGDAGIADDSKLAGHLLGKTRPHELQSKHVPQIAAFQSWLTISSLNQKGNTLLDENSLIWADDMDAGPRKPKITYFIVHGTPCVEFPGVGALRFDNQLHCTATAIGPHTVLTAAHCLVGYEPERMVFITGKSAFVPAHTYEVTATLPNADYDESKESGNADIGLVYTKTLITEELVVVPERALTLTVDAPLRFVGYGFTSSPGGNRSPTVGIKTCATIPINSSDPVNIYYGRQGVQTCNGDSGGPAFTNVAENSPVIAGVTSYGRGEFCREGAVDVRVDRFLQWISDNKR